MVLLGPHASARRGETRKIKSKTTISLCGINTAPSAILVLGPRLVQAGPRASPHFGEDDGCCVPSASLERGGCAGIEVERVALQSRL